MKAAFIAVCLLVVAGAATRWWRRMRARRRWSLVGDFEQRRLVAQTVAIADSLPERLEGLGDAGALAAAVAGGGHPRACVEDLDEDLARLALLADDAARRAARTELPAALLRRVTGRPLPGEQRLRDAARRRVLDADAAVARLEAVVVRLRDRQALLDGGRDTIRTLLDRALHDAEHVLATARVPLGEQYWVSQVRGLAAELAEAVERPTAEYAALERQLRELQTAVADLREAVEQAEQDVVEEQARRERAQQELAARERAAAAAAAREAALAADPDAAAAAERARQVRQAEETARLAAQRFPHPA